MPDGSPWPRITVITPSYNQGQFIEETIRSVLLQGYPDLEYMVIDGGSSDGSVDTIRRYEPWLAYWVSEPDRGQAHAINKGLRRATGDIIAYLNSDDTYFPDILVTVVRLFRETPIPDPEGASWLVGACRYSGLREDTWSPHPPPSERLRWVLDELWTAPQASTFWHRTNFERVGLFREDMHYAFDSEFGLRLLFNGLFPTVTPEVLARRFLHDECKTVRDPQAFRTESGSFPSLFWAYLTREERRQCRSVLADRHLALCHAQAGSGRWFACLLSCARAFAASPGFTWHRGFWTVWRRAQRLPRGRPRPDTEPRACPESSRREGPCPPQM